jgi:hypothetical protein
VDRFVAIALLVMSLSCCQPFSIQYRSLQVANVIAFHQLCICSASDDTCTKYLAPPILMTMKLSRCILNVTYCEMRHTRQ